GSGIAGADHEGSESVAGAFALQVGGVGTRRHFVTETKYCRGEPAAVVCLPDAHIPERNGLCSQRFVQVYGQAGVVLRETGLPGALRRSQRSIVTAATERVPKLNLRKLRRPRIEDPR